MHLFSVWVVLSQQLDRRPTCKQLAEAAKIRSTATVHKRLTELERCGWLKRDYMGHHTLRMPDQPYIGPPGAAPPEGPLLPS
jgi:hypothetical protein